MWSGYGVRYARRSRSPSALAPRLVLGIDDQPRKGLWDYFVQTTHPGTIQLEGDTAVGRAYISELGHLRDGRSQLNYSVYHDRYQRTPTAGNSRNASTRSDISTPLRCRARRPTQRGPPTNPLGALIRSGSECDVFPTPGSLRTTVKGSRKVHHFRQSKSAPSGGG